MKLTQPIRAKDSLIYLLPVPTQQEGYLIIDRGNKKAEVIYYDTVGPNYIETKKDPNTGLTEGVGRGLDSTQQTDHDTFAEVGTYAPYDFSNLSKYVKDSSQIELSIGNTQIIIKPYLPVKGKS